MSRNVSFSGKRLQQRHRLITRLIRNLLLTVGASSLCSNTLANGGWDCRAGSDGDWQCSQGGVPEVRPGKSTSTVITPLREPSATPPTVAPAPADIQPASRPEDKTASSAPAGAAGPAAQAEPGQSNAQQALPPASISTAPAQVPQAPVQDESPYVIDNTVKPSTPPAAMAVEHPPAHAEAIAKPMPGPKTVDTQPPPVREPVPAQPGAAPEPPKAGANAKIAVSPEPAEAAPAAQPGPSTVMPTPETGSARTAGLDKGIAWQRCNRVDTPFNSDDSRLPIEVTADGAEASELDMQVSFSGNVQLIQGSQQIFADQMRYQHANGNLFASGDVLLLRPDLRIAADQMQYNLRTQQGEARQAEYRLPGILARGTAEKATLVDAHHSRYTRINYTTCQPGNNDWQLEADTLQLDTAEGLGTAGDARLRFKGVPVMYLPKLTFPIDDRRRSGLLIPSLGYGDKHGLDLSLPYYFNLAPNYDLTLTPRLMSRRGIMLSGEFRFLTKQHQGEIHGSFIPDDQLAPRGTRHRGSLSLQGHSQYNDRLSSAVDINYVSDSDFLQDFGPDVETYSNSVLERRAAIHYRESIWSASATVQQFQTIDPLLSAASRPYAVLPRLRFDAQDDLDLAFPARYSLKAEFANFSKDGGVVEGRRLDLYPRLAIPMREAWYHLTPAMGLRYTRYQLDKQAAGLDTSPDRFTPILSLDSGLYFDRNMNWFGQTAVQTLEPRAYYLYVPNKNQTNIPVFDTTGYDLSFTNLFQENRFNSADRQGDANQVTLAFTSTVSDMDSGRQLLKTRLGQTFYLADRKVQLPGVVTQTQQTSPLIADLSAELSQQWHTRGELVWDPDSNNLQQALARASYRADRDHIFSASYRLRDIISSETDVAAIWPLGRQTRAIARWNYSLSERRNLDALLGFEYGHCCWKVRTLLRQQVTGTNNDQNLSFLVQLELRGLGKLGDNIDAVLKDGIYGYR